MRYEVTMPRLGQDMENGVVVEWFKSPGDSIAEGEMLAVIETDKAEVEFEAPAGGFVVAIVAEPGTSAAVGDTIAWISSDPTDQPPVVQPSVSSEAPASDPGPAADAATRSADQPPAARPDPAGPGSRRASSPLARRRAAALGVDIEAIEGSGPGGRVTEADVLRAGEDPATGAHGDSTPQLPRMRIAIAAHMTAAAVVPQFQIMREVTVDESEGIRKASGASYTDLILWATAHALADHPGLNARWVDGDPPRIDVLPDVHLGFALAVEDGLLAPVIRNADQRSLAETAGERRRLEEAVKNGRPAARDLEGATFTVSNLGSAGVDEFSAILNTPEAGILAVGSVRERPVVQDGVVTIAQTTRLTLTGDHRVFDGLAGARFMESVARILSDESPETEREKT